MIDDLFSAMNFVSLRDAYDLYKCLTENDLYGLYESAFNETIKEIPDVNKHKGELSHLNNEMRGKIGDITRYKDLGNFKNEILSIYHKKVKEDIPENTLKQFLDKLFKNLEKKILSHPKVRDQLMYYYMKHAYKNTTEIKDQIEHNYQCKPSNGIRTPEGICKTDLLTAGFVAKLRLVLGSQVEVLGKVNHAKIIKLMGKMEGDPEYVVKNSKKAAEVCNILIESYDSLPPDVKEAKIAFCIILSKVTGIIDLLESCGLPSRYDEFNFQAHMILSTIALNQGDINSAKAHLKEMRNYIEGGGRVLVGILEGRIFIEEYKREEAIEHLENVLNDADFYEKKIILSYLGFAYFFISSLNKSLKCWNKLKKIEYDKRKKSAIIGNIGIIFMTKGKINKALKYLEEALEIDRKIGNREGEANQLGNIGLTYKDKGEMDEALKCFEQSLEIDREIGNREGEASNLGNIGTIYKNKGDLDKALKYHNKALEIDREIGYREGEASNLGNIGLICIARGDLEKGLEYHRKSLRIFRKIGYRLGEADQLRNIGIIYDKEGNSEEALRYFKEALEISRTIDYKKGEAGLLGDIGITLKLYGKYTAALKNLNKSLEIFEKIGMKTEADEVSKYILELCLKYR
jgi:tetratricopeptide (TPR) repeat protein